MEWTELLYARKEVNKAGDILISSSSSREEFEWATKVLDNWRSSHSFPLNTFKKRLKSVSKGIDSDALVVQRLKRTPSILKKLKDPRNKNMRLSQIQDIGGCRSVLKNVDLVNKLCSEYYQDGRYCDIKHNFKKKNDYISKPKEDGYRSIHLIYYYWGDKTEAYDGLQIEIQVRTTLQHIWATAVETVGHFTNQAIKSNEGDKEWRDFFKLMSSVFAKEEKKPIVPNTPSDDIELYDRVKVISDKLKIIKKITHWSKLFRMLEKFPRNNIAKFYLLQLDINGRLNITPFSSEREEKAHLAYSDAERKAFQEKVNKDIVLVEADTSRELKKAYPNYFLDVHEFLKILQNYLDNPPKSML